ncbi:MAG: hypothetical protein AB2A00_08850 [Myxococcota bacterium]
MTAAIMFLLTLSTQTPDALANQRALVLPMSLPQAPSSDVKAAAPGVEAALVDALTRHATFRVIGRQEMNRMLDRAVQEQLRGCDTDECLAQIYQAMDADLVVTSQLSLVDGVWGLQAALLERKTGKAVRRMSVRARSLDGLLRSVEQTALHLAGGAQVGLQDPKLQTRLGTDATGVRLLRDAMEENPDDDVAQSWTDVIIARNTESGWLALAEGALVFAGGVLASGTGLAGYLAESMFLGAVYAANFGPDANVGGLPVVPLILAVLLPAPCIVAALVPLLAAATVAIVDQLDLGRVPAARKGCCRDDERIARAGEPGVLHRVAPVLAFAGACCALLGPVPLFCNPGGVIPLEQGTLGPVLSVGWPVVLLTLALFLPVESLWTVVLSSGVSLAAFVAGVALVVSGRNELVDEEEPSGSSVGG